MLQVSVDVVEIVPEKGVIGKKYRKEAKPLMEWLATLTKTQIEDLEKNLTDNGQVFNIIVINHMTIT